MILRFFPEVGVGVVALPTRETRSVSCPARDTGGIFPWHSGERTVGCHHWGTGSAIPGFGWLGCLSLFFIAGRQCVAPCEPGLCFNTLLGPIGNNALRSSSLGDWQWVEFCGSYLQDFHHLCLLSSEFRRVDSVGVAGGLMFSSGLGMPWVFRWAPSQLRLFRWGKRRSSWGSCTALLAPAFATTGTGYKFVVAVSDAAMREVV